MKFINRIFSIVIIFLLLGLPSLKQVKAASGLTTVGEGNDFATQVLGDAWDMSQFTDISTYLNQSGQVNQLTNIQVANGILSAKSVSWGAPVTLLFPGYKNALLIGKVGHQFPINAKTYKCIYIAAKVDSGPPQNGTPDQMLFTWFANENLNSPGGIWGETIPGIMLSSGWQLFSANLSNVTKLAPGSTAWNNAPSGQWQGLMVTPTIQNTTFQIDWARLTDCAAKNISIGWSGTGAVSVYIRPENTTNDIKVINSTTSNPINLDVEGFQAGNYTYFIKQGSTTLASANFQVTEAPVVTFDRPSPTSGEDFYSPDNENLSIDSSEIASTQCISYSISNGIIFTDTPTVQNQPANTCQGGGYNDPEISFTQNTPIDTNQYRYLTFRMFTAGLWQNVPLGMIVRVVWYWNNRCILVSSAVPLDVGWQTYTVDLWDPIQGAVDDHSITGCPNPPLSWRSTSPASQFRLKLNENITGQVMHQEISWMKLTKPDTVRAGDEYQILVRSNKTLDQSQYGFYYTTSLSNPLEHNVALSGSDIRQNLPTGPNFIFIPVVTQHFYSDPGTIPFYWDTSGVPVGSYYICVKTQDGYNTTTYCSNTPVQVTP